MGVHTEEFLLSVLSLAIADWTTKSETFMKHKNRIKGNFIDEIYEFCKHHMRSTYDFIEFEDNVSTANNHSLNDANNKKKISGSFSFIQNFMLVKNIK